VDWIIEAAKFIWEIMSSQESMTAMSFGIFIILAMVNYGAIIIILNSKRLQTRKEKSMELVDAAVENIHGVMNQHYYKIAKETFGEDFLQELETRLTEYLYEKAINSCKSHMRRRVRKNGFEEKKPQEWRMYVEAEIEEDMVRVTKFLNDMWPHHTRLKRDQVYDHNQAITNAVRRILGKLYEQFLEIATQYKLHKFLAWRIKL
jgi:hypothetical protein